MGRFGKIIRVLCWKNMLLMKRKPAVQLLIFASPILLFGLFGGELKPLVNGMKKWECTRPLDAEGSSGDTQCEWRSFPPIIDNATAGAGSFPFGFVDNFDDTSAASFRDITMGCNRDEFRLFVVNGNTTAKRRTLVDRAVGYLGDTLTAQGKRHVGLPWNVTATHTDEAGLLREYTAMAASNLSVLGGSGCFFGVAFDSAPDPPNGHLRITLRPPYVPGGFWNELSWDATTSSLTPRTWNTGSATPPASPIFVASPRNDGIGSHYVSSMDEVGSTPGYAFFGFLAVQHAFSVAALAGDDGATSAAAEALGRLQLNRLPYPEYNSDLWAVILLSAAPWAIFLPLMFASSQLVRDMVQEKQDRIKAAMMMMGVHRAHHWLAWFLRGLFSIGLALVVVTSVSVGLKLFPVDGSILLIFFLLSAISIIAQTFLVSTLFNRATNAAFCAGFGMYLTLLPFQYGISQQATSNQAIPISDPSTQMAVCLLPGSCIGLGFYSIAGTVVLEGHIGWDNLMVAPGPESLSFGHVLLMLVADVLWVFAAASYIEAVFPGEFGVPLHPLFPLVWIRDAVLGRREDPVASVAGSLPTAHAEVTEVEPVDHDAVVGMATDSLVKVFPARSSGGAPVAAVNNLSLPILQDQITCLLGENGAGKTVTMSMLCGLYPPTSGTMQVEGRDAAGNQEFVHERLGVCPQHDVLWPSLTVEEHLYLFGRLKGVPPAELERACTTMLHDLSLDEKRYAQTKTLSGGQKRRLSCGIALIGGSSCVILDEPTSGCDPKARRQIWDLLLRHKRGRTIMLSTHFMDEADTLGDRVAIMSSGRLIAAGSPAFLKSRYGTGYTLTVAKRADCDTSAVAALVKKHVPQSAVKSDIGTELSLRVPKRSVAAFPPLLRELDEHKADLHVDSFGVTITTMEEVFLAANRRAADAEAAALAGSAAGGGDAAATGAKRTRSGKPVTGASPHSSQYEDDDGDDDGDVPLLPMHKGDGSGSDASPGGHDVVVLRPSIATQLAALLWKRKLKVFSEPIFTSCQIVVPVLLLCIHLMVPLPSDAGNAQPRELLPTAPLYDPASVRQWAGPSGAAYVASTGGGLTTDGMSIPDFVGNYTQGAFAFNRIVQTGLSVDGDNVTAWFNGQYYHTIAEAHLLAVNLLLSANATSAPESPAPRISLVNAPMPKTPLEDSSKGGQIFGSAMGFAMAALFAMNAFGCMTVYAPVDEAAVNAKHMQFVSGVSYRVYWLAYWLSDYAIALVLTAAALLTSSVGSSKVWDGDGAAAAAVLLVTFFVGYLWALYVVSLWFTTPANAVRFVLFFQLFFGFIPVIVTPIVRLLGYAHTADTITDAFLWLPVFSVAQGLSWVGTNFAAQQQADKIVKLQAGIPGMCHTVDECCSAMRGLECNTDYFAWEYPGCLRFVVAHLVQCAGYALILALFEEKVIARLLSAAKQRFVPNRPDPVPRPVDEDVRAETARVQSGRAVAQDAIVVNNAHKSFNFGKVKAVDGVTLGIPKRECFGLLGVNGAGKSTLFKAFTGDHLLDSGSISIAGFDVRSQLRHVQARIGYVPQDFNALLGYMTGRQLLEFYALIKGVPARAIPGAVEHLIAKLNLTKHAGKPCKTFSGGNKRKLSVAAALVGGPGIILLDEPTTGMDPGSRRFLWDVILGLVEDGRSVVLTTHSMEEGEALCSRLTIMVKGRMQCLGSPQHLKHRFGSGYVARVVAGDPAEGAAPVGVVLAALRARFPGMVVQDTHKSTVSCKIDGSVALADLFQALEELKNQLGLLDYSASQTSLEQIFLRYANEDGAGAAPEPHAGGVGPGGLATARPVVARFDTRTGQLISTSVPSQIQG